MTDAATSLPTEARWRLKTPTWSSGCRSALDPQLLGHTSFSGWNHYYTVDYSVPPIQGPTQNVTYPNDQKINVGNVHSSQGIEITMEMRPAVREHHVVGQAYEKPRSTRGTQAWHFMGTVNYTDPRVLGTQRLFVGDASAVEPFTATRACRPPGCWPSSRRWARCAWTWPRARP